MQIGPLSISWTKGLQLAPLNQWGGGWWPVIRESYTGAWQMNVEVRLVDVLSHPIVFACMNLVASYIAKMGGVRLVELTEDGIWLETERAAFSPVLRKPNRYQNRIEFFEQWMLSKLAYGNTYVLLARDSRRAVVEMFILDPTHCRPLVAPDGSVYYELDRNELAEVPDEHVIVPASEIIHNRFNCFYHALVGLPPIYASGVAAMMGLKMIANSSSLFANGSNPGGILLVPGTIKQAHADELKASWDTNYTGTNVGKVAVLADGMKFQPMRMTAVDSQYKEQLDWVSQMICSTFAVPPYMVGVGPYPSYNNVEALTQIFYDKGLQIHIESIELSLDEGLGLAPDKIDGVRLGTEMDLTNLLRMDTATQMETLKVGVMAALVTPNEGRKQLGLPPIEGGNAAYLQEQNYSLAALNERDQNDPFAKPAPAPAAAPALPSQTETARTMTPTKEAEKTQVAAAMMAKLAVLSHAA